MVVVTSLFNLVISSFPDNIMFYHVCINNMVVDLSWWFQQRCSRVLSSREHHAMNKPVNNHVEAGQFNHVQAG